jgi:hypothetical protein
MSKLSGIVRPGTAGLSPQRRRVEGSNRQRHIPLGVRALDACGKLVVGQNRQRANDTNQARSGSHSPNARDDRSLLLVAQFCSPHGSCDAMRWTRCTGSVHPNSCARRSLKRGADGDQPDSQRWAHLPVHSGAGAVCRLVGSIHGCPHQDHRAHRPDCAGQSFGTLQVGPAAQARAGYRAFPAPSRSMWTQPTRG